MKILCILFILVIISGTVIAQQNTIKDTTSGLKSGTNQSVILIQRVEAYKKWIMLNDTATDYYSTNGWTIQDLLVSKARYDSLNIKGELANFNSWLQKLTNTELSPDSGKIIYRIKQRY